jgi:hypothetical protein
LGKKSGAFRGRFEFASLTPAAARARLQAWIGELLATASPGLLPLEELVQGTHLAGPEALRDAILERASKPDDFSAFKTGPLTRAERYPVEPDPAAAAERRLGDFLAQIARSGRLEGVE